MNDKKIADLSFGQDNEIRVKQRLERLFGPLETTEKMDEFDFKNDSFIIELKSRRVTKNKYPSTMVGENKVIKGFEYQVAGRRVFFVFDFVDCMCLWELNRDEYHVKHGGRWDRGKAEIKSYCYIPTKYLLQVKEDADKITAERTEAGTHHEEAIRQAAVQNARRNHQEQQEEGQEAGQEGEALEDDTFLIHRDSDESIIVEESDDSIKSD